MKQSFGGISILVSGHSNFKHFSISVSPLKFLKYASGVEDSNAVHGPSYVHPPNNIIISGIFNQIKFKIQLNQNIFMFVLNYSTRGKMKN